MGVYIALRVDGRRLDLPKNDCSGVAWGTEWGCQVYIASNAESSFDPPSHEL